MSDENQIGCEVVKPTVRQLAEEILGEPVGDPRPEYLIEFFAFEQIGVPLHSLSFEQQNNLVEQGRELMLESLSVPAHMIEEGSSSLSQQCAAQHNAEFARRFPNHRGPHGRDQEAQAQPAYPLDDKKGYE